MDELVPKEGVINYARRETLTRVTLTLLMRHA